MVCFPQHDSVTPEAEELIASQPLLIASQPFDRHGLVEIAIRLPQSDADLHELLAGTVANRDRIHFDYLVCAAALAGRRLEASLLAGGMMLMPDAADRFAWIAWHMEGDVMENILAALRGPAFYFNVRAMALFIAAAWWLKHREGPVPSEIVAEARKMVKLRNVQVDVILSALQALIGNKALEAALPTTRTVRMQMQAAAYKDALLAALEVDFVCEVPEKEDRGFSGRQPMRRSVESIGRNEKCPCGSGQKYKKCCERKDERRLRLSSDVAGKTSLELLEDPAADLTATRLPTMLPVDLSRIEATDVPPDLLPEFLRLLTCYECFEEIAKAFQCVGVTPKLEAVWKQALLIVTRGWKPEIARRLVLAHPTRESILPELDSGVRLMLASLEPGKFLPALEAEARGALTSRDKHNLCVALLGSPYAGLGIFLARSALPLVEETNFLFDQILTTRDKLNLPPEDEFSDWMDQRALQKARRHETAAMQEAQDKLAAKLEELRGAKEERARLERELALRNRQERRESELAQSSTTPDEQGARERRELKTKIERLNALVTQRGEEKLTLRRELEKAGQENEALRSIASTPEPKEAEERDETEHFEVAGNQPVRLIEFPKGFAETLAGYPRHVGRATMNRIGRIASGEPAAFDRVKQLKAYPEVLRARVADKHRLLFCLLPDRVRVVDLIRRADLDRRIERLQASGLPPIG